MANQISSRELLELAAKAICKESGLSPFDLLVDGTWQPLNDDGDCARLESALEINVSWSMCCVESNCGGVSIAGEFAKFGGDKTKARRYASTRVAAELGLAMSTLTK